jgi:hypothetical protein
MKKTTLPVIIVALIALLVIGAALLWLSLRPTSVPPPPPKTAATQEAKALPKVITLFQKGEGESDLAVYVQKELSAKAGTVANFSVIDTSDEPQMLEFYGVNSVPAIIFLTSAGKVYRVHEGYLDKGAILSILRSMK